MFVNNVVKKSNLNIQSIENTLKNLHRALRNEKDGKRIKEIHEDITYYSNILYSKADFKTYFRIMEEADNLRNE